MRTKKRDIFFLILFGVTLLLLTACTQETEVQENTENEQTSEETKTVLEEESNTLEEESNNVEEQSKDVTIEITTSGFSPSTITIEIGTTVTFVNQDTERHWPASNAHPTHTSYPTTGGCISSTFDACTGLEQGESFSFTFEEEGEWDYHDHLSPSLGGTIIVG